MKRRNKVLSGMLLFFVIAITGIAVTLSHTDDCEPPPNVPGNVELMKSIVAPCYGDTDVLEYVDVEKPKPQQDEILVRVQAAAVNPLDWHYMRGSPYIMRLSSGLGSPVDTTVGVDFSGTVVEIGENVTRFQIGDEVFGGRGGAFSEYVIVPEDRAVVAKPENVSFEQAAAVPIAGVTALQALRDKGKLESGQKVLINGASGGVGTFAVQIAKSMGAEVTGVCSTRNLEMVRRIGADHVIDYKRANYTELGQKYDVIVDNVGNHSLSKNRRVLTPEGKLVIVGGGKGNWLGPLVTPLKALFVSPFVKQELVTILAELNQDDLNALASLMAAGKVAAVIDKRFDLNDVRSAVQYSESGRARGKIIIEFN